MKLVVIEGGLSSPSPLTLPEVIGSPTPENVRAEATRRIRETGCEKERLREFMTGRPMPRALLHLQLQINFVAEALCKLQRIPEDFREDFYWPAV